MLVEYPVLLMMVFIKLTWCQDSGNMHDPFAIVITWLALLSYKISLLNVRTVSFLCSKTVLVFSSTAIVASKEWYQKAILHMQ